MMPEPDLQVSKRQGTRSSIDRLAYFVATGFYSGLSPIMPGTCGTAVAALCWGLAVNAIPKLSEPRMGVGIALFVIFIALLATAVATRAEYFGAAKEGEKQDPQQIVIDEFAGYLVTTLGAPGGDLRSLVLTFILFRLFDMTKPPPIKRIERFKSPFGIVLDDVLAGVYAGVLCWFVGIYFT